MDRYTRTVIIRDHQRELLREAEIARMDFGRKPHGLRTLVTSSAARARQGVAAVARAAHVAPAARKTPAHV